MVKLSSGIKTSSEIFQENKINDCITLAPRLNLLNESYRNANERNVEILK